jgi:hypothetical protein
MANWKFFLDNIEVEEPIGWDAVEFTARRTEEHGIDQPFSTELSFYGKGAKYLKQKYDVEFINAEIAIKITSDVSYNGANFEFEGFVNMAIYSERNVCDTDSWEVTVGILDDNFREKFKSRMDVDLDIYSNRDLDGNIISEPEFEETRLHTQEVYLVAFAQSIAQIYPINYWAQLFWTYDNGWKAEDFACVIPAYFNNTDFRGAFGATKDPDQVKWSGANYCFRNLSNHTRKITFSVNVRGAFTWGPQDGDFGETANLSLVIGKFYNNCANKGCMSYEQFLDVSAINTFNSGLNVQFNMSGTHTATLEPGTWIIIYIQWGNNGNVYPGKTMPNDITRRLYVYVDDCCLSVTEKNAAEYASFAQTLKVEKFLKRLVHIITGDNDGFISNTFSQQNNGCYWNYALTNGLKIRNAKTAASAAQICNPLATIQATRFKTSFKKVFEGLSAIFCLGWAFEYVNGKWKVRVETLDYFYQNQVAFTAENVGEVVQSAMTKDLANQFTIGYDDTWKNIQAAGIWAIHTDRNYYINNRAMAEGTTNKIELLSTIIAEGYAIEFSRRMYFFQDDSGSSDRPNDYELFIIWLNRSNLTISNIQTSEYRLNPSENETGTITLSLGSASMSSRRINQSNSEVGDLYNVFITPARNALRWWKYIGMHTYGMSSPKLLFQSGEYQTTYSSYITKDIEPCQEYCDGCLVAENIDINPQLMNAESKGYLFKPIEVEFNYPQSLCDFLVLSQDEPYKKVRLTSGSLTIEGFIQEASNQPESASGGTTKFRLLVSNQQSQLRGAFDDGFDDGYENGG